MKFFFLKGLPLCSIIILAHFLFVKMPNRSSLPPARAQIIFSPVELAEPDGALTLAGAWSLTSADPRLGGISGLARDQDGFVAISDLGAVVRFGMPEQGTSSVARFADLPSGPGSRLRKAGNDAEAIARDPDGRGWWVAFEVDHQLRLFDDSFAKTLEVAPIEGTGWPANLGIEGIAEVGRSLFLFGEGGGAPLILENGLVRRSTFRGGFGRLADSAALPDGGILLLSRTIRPWGFVSRLLIYEPDTGVVEPLADLPLSYIDNAEALAVERIDSERLRIWIMTDSDSRARSRTLLAAFDWKL